MESTAALSGLPQGQEPSLGEGPRLLVSPPADGATNMAIDEALLLRAGRHKKAIWVYAWERTTVSLGGTTRARCTISSRTTRGTT